MKPTRSWIVIADGAQARIFENHGPGKGLVPLPGESLNKSPRPSREIDTDRPGRTHDRFGPGRHALEPTSDPHREEKRRFADLLGEHLNEGAQNHSYDRLVLVAPPKTLGDLRQVLSKEATSKIDGELAKDLTNVSEQDLPDHLGEVIAV